MTREALPQRLLWSSTRIWLAAMALGVIAAMTTNVAACTNLGERCHKGYPSAGSFTFVDDEVFAGYAVDWGTVESHQGRIVITFGLEQGGVYRVVFQAED